MSSDICGLILAAGFSSRMGCIKPLLRIKGMTMLDMTTQSLMSAGVEHIYTVLGCYRDEIEPCYELRDKVHIVYNPRYAEGMFTSVQAGVRAIDNRHDGFMMIPADCPGVTPHTIKSIMALFPRQGRIIQPSYKGKKGHPCLISLEYADEILTGSFGEGMRTLIARHQDQLTVVDTDDDRILADIDTMADYHNITK